MIRIVYRWRVRPGEETAFRSAWEETTTGIRARVRGARGSVLLRSHDDPQEHVTIARWDNLEAWKGWHGKAPHVVQREMQTMHDLAELLSTQVFDEIQDYTA